MISGLPGSVKEGGSEIKSVATILLVPQQPHLTRILRSLEIAASQVRAFCGYTVFSLSNEPQHQYIIE